MSSVESYVANVKNATRLLPTWQPDSPLKLGDICTFEDDGILVHNNLLTGFSDVPAITELQTRTSKPAAVKLDHYVSYSAAVEGALPGVFEAEVEFTHKEGFLLTVEDGEEESFAAAGPLGSALIALANDGRWEYRWFLVEAVRKYGSMTLVLSGERGAKVAVSATAPGPAGIGSVKAGASLQVRSGRVAHWTSNGPLTPFYKAMSVGWSTHYQNPGPIIINSDAPMEPEEVEPSYLPLSEWEATAPWQDAS